jgi:uncharacterized membrane protein (DUF485 family)
MSITKGQFRWLVTAYIVVTILSVVVHFVGEPSLPSALRNYLKEDLEAGSAKNVAITVVFFPLLIAWVVSIIALYRLWRFARPLTVVLCIIELIFQVFTGANVRSGVEASLDDLAAMLIGIILAVIYVTPASTWFEKKPDT